MGEERLKTEASCFAIHTKVRQMREVLREVVTRAAGSPNRRIRDELLIEEEWPNFGTWFNLHAQNRHSMCRSA